MFGNNKDRDKLNKEIEALKARIVELEDAEQVLDVTLLDWQATFDAIHDPVMLLDENNKVLRTNRATEKFLGLASADIIGKTCYKVMHNSDSPIPGCPLEKAKRSRRHEEAELYLKDKDRWVSVSFDPIIDAKDNFLGGVHIIIDITERRITQSALDNEASFHAAVIKNAAEGIAVCHEAPEFPYVNFTVWNDRMAEITGYTVEEINNNGWYQSVYPDPEYQEKARQRMGRMRQGDNLRNEEWMITRSDGQKRILWISTGIIKSTDGMVHVMAVMQDVTERREAEDRVLSVSRFPSENPSPVLRVGKDGSILYANAAAESEVLNICKCNIGGFIPEQWRAHIRVAFESPERKAGEFEAQCGERVFSFIVAVFREAGYANLYGRDITERKSTERALLSLNSLLSSTVESVFNGILVVGRQGEIVRFNRKFAEMWGIPEAVLDTRDDKKALDFVVTQLKDPEGFLHKVQELYNDPERESYDTLEFKDGRVFERYSRPQRINHEVIGRVWTFHDATERKTLERDVLRERDLAQTYLNAAGVAMVVIGADEKVVLVNQKACEILEVDKKAVIGKNWFDNFIPEADREKTRSVFHRLMQGEVGLFGYNENKVIAKGGDKLIAWNNTWLKDETGKVIGTLSSGEDITEKRRAEERLESSEKLYHLLADNIADFVWTTDMDFNFIYVSPSVYKFLGYRPEELEYKPGGLVITPESLAEGMKLLAEELVIEAKGSADISRTRIVRFEHVRKDGKIVWAEANIGFSRDEHKKPTGLIGICRDITDRMKLEAEARKHVRELEVFYKTSAGREERILELKEQVRKLNKELGRNS